MGGGREGDAAGKDRRENGAEEKRSSPVVPTVQRGHLKRVNLTFQARRQE